jgi:hypothetical protein
LNLSTHASNGEGGATSSSSFFFFFLASYLFILAMNETISPLFSFIFCLKVFTPALRRLTGGGLGLGGGGPGFGFCSCFGAVAACDDGVEGWAALVVEATWGVAVPVLPVAVVVVGAVVADVVSYASTSST